MSKFGDYSVHNEWQRHKSGDHLFKSVKKDRKVVGTLRKYNATGNTEFVFERRAEDLVYCKDAWSIQGSMISLLRCIGSPNIQIHVSNGDTHQITFSDFIEKMYRKDDPKSFSYVFVNFSDFVFTKGETESIEHAIKIGKWK